MRNFIVIAGVLALLNIGATRPVTFSDTDVRETASKAFHWIQSKYPDLKVDLYFSELVSHAGYFDGKLYVNPAGFVSDITPFLAVYTAYIIRVQEPIYDPALIVAWTVFHEIGHAFYDIPGFEDDVKRLEQIETVETFLQYRLTQSEFEADEFAIKELEDYRRFLNEEILLHESDSRQS